MLKVYKINYTFLIANIYLIYIQHIIFQQRICTEPLFRKMTPPMNIVFKIWKNRTKTVIKRNYIVDSYKLNSKKTVHVPLKLYEEPH